jgi:hypothetical protein
MQVSGLHDAVWISHLTLIWQDHRDEKEGASPVIGRERRKGVHHRRTGETRVVSTASLRASTQEI